MQANVKHDIKAGYRAAQESNWVETAKNPKDWVNWNPIKPEDHPNQNLLVPDQTQFVVTRMIRKAGWGYTRFKIIANTAAEAGKIAAAFCGAIYAEKPEPEDVALIRAARKARL